MILDKTKDQKHLILKKTGSIKINVASLRRKISKNGLTKEKEITIEEIITKDDK